MLLFNGAPWWWWLAQPSESLSRETTIMMILSIFGSLIAIGMLCWLLFTLAVFALPAFAGVTAGAWAYQTGAGLPGSALVGIAVAGAVFGIGHLLLAFARPLWLRLTVALAFVVPAGIAGFHATHGIVQHLMPSDGWQFAFSIIGAGAVAVTAFCRVVAMAPPGPAGQNTAAV